MADSKIAYGTSTEFTVTNLHSLATSSTLVAGWASNNVDNGTNLYVDYQITAQIVLHSTAPVVGSVQAFAFALDDGSSWPDLFTASYTGAEGTKSVDNANGRDAGLKFLWSADVSSSANSQVITMPPISIAGAFGGVCPDEFAIWIVQDSGQIINAAGSTVTYRGIYYTSA